MEEVKNVCEDFVIGRPAEDVLKEAEEALGGKPAYEPDGVNEAYDCLVSAYVSLSGLVRDMAEDMEERVAESGEYLPQLCKTASETLRVLSQVGRELRTDKPQGDECGVVILAAADIGEP